MTQLRSLTELLQGWYSGADFDVLRAKGLGMQTFPQ